jgi:hypothetical protein
MVKNSIAFDKILESLIQVAQLNGASDAKAVLIANVRVDKSLTNFCKDSRCENYGLSINCPPHVSGPTGFKELLKDYEQAVVCLSHARLGIPAGFIGIDRYLSAVSLYSPWVKDKSRNSNTILSV